MENRAYSLFEVKSLDNEKRTFRGIATTPTPDRVGDIVNPLGATFKNPLPLLWNHDHSKPIGTVRFSKPTEKGIEFEAEVASVSEAGVLKDRLDEVWQMVKAGLVRAVSIGFRPLQFERIKDGGLHFLKSEIFELSAVVIPANSEATISLAKSLDKPYLQAAIGTDGEKSIKSAGVTANKDISKKTFKDTNSMNKTFAESRAEFETKRAQNLDQMDNLLAKSAEDGVTLSAEDEAEYEALATENKSLDAHIERLKAREADTVSKATRIEGVKSFADAGKARDRQQVIVKGTNLPKGTAFTRYAMAIAKSNGNLMQAAEIAKGFKDTPEVETVLKAAVAAGTTTDADWARPLVEYQTMAGEFVELLRPETILGKLDGFRRVPFNVRLVGQSSGSSVNWVGEASPKPVSELAFNAQQLGFAKLAGIVVVSDELVKFSNPQVTSIVQQDLIASIAGFLDVAFLDPTKAAVPGVSPASITNGVTAIPASGTTADNLKADVQAVFRQFLASGQSVAGSYWIMSATQALAIAMLQNAVGNAEFPGLSMNGGTFFGLPVVVSEAPVTQGRIVLVKTSEILLAEEGIVIDSSREASIVMDTNPAGSSAAAVSLFQNNLVGIRAERFINWGKRRANAVAVISGADYGS